MVETTIQDIIDHPRGFVFSDPVHCGPCRVLEERFKDFNFPWVKFDLHGPDKNVLAFIESNKLNIMGIPRYIEYDADNGFCPSEKHPGKVFDDALFEYAIYGTESKLISQSK